MEIRRIGNIAEILAVCSRVEGEDGVGEEDEDELEKEREG